MGDARTVDTIGSKGNLITTALFRWRISRKLRRGEVVEFEHAGVAARQDDGGGIEH
jgi:hypothetical protein